MSSPVLLAIGNPLLDMQVRNGEELLKKYDLKANDAILAEDKHQPIYKEVKSLNPVYVAGGAAQNAARCAQYVLPPSSTIYLGAVGKDELADQLRDANKKEGLAQEYMVVESHPTGACAVVITGHDRSLCTRLGAAEQFSKAHLKKPEVVKAIEGAKYFYLGGFFLTHGVESALELAQHAASTGKTFAMNLSAPFIAQFFKDQVDTIMPYVDVLFGNESEAAAYAESHGWETKDVATIAAKLSRLPKTNSTRPRVAVITQGASSTFVASASPASFKSSGVKTVDDAHVLTVPVTPLPDSAIVDTNGAGDAFAGGYMGALISGKTVEDCVEVGHRLGQMCVGQVGPTLKWPKEAVMA